MIILETIQFKNLLSFGNAETTIDLRKDRSTMVIGKSGNGKSTIVEAICFALYGMPFRKIPKGKLVNTVNNKDCRVALTLSTPEAGYRIVRGIKPDIFEIYRNGELVEQQAASRDYQKWLESNVLKMNMKTFVQIVILGYANHTPFMEMTASQRRTMVDEILGLDVFTKMGVLLNAKVKELKNDLVLAEREIELMKSSLVDLKSTVVKLHSQDKEKEKIILAEIEELNKIIQHEQEDADKLNAAISEKLPLVSELSNLQSKLKSYESVISKLESNVERLRIESSFFETNTSCSTCKQPITDEHKKSIVTELKSKEEELLGALTKASAITREISESIREINRHSVEISALERQLYQKTTNITMALRDITSKQASIKTLQNSDSSLTAELSKKVLETVNLIQDKTSFREELIQSRYLYDVAQTLLKDDGIKAQIIKEYIPALNRMVNEYLDQMGFHLKFELNEEFDEKILSRFRDTLTFHCLSQGEQSRLNFALSLAWRRLAELRNSAKVNIIFLDEMLDKAISAADAASVWMLVDKLSTESNIWIISHQPDMLSQKVNRIFVVNKHGNFSHIGEDNVT